MLAELPGAQVERAVVDGQEPRIGVEVGGHHRQRRIALRELQHGAEPVGFLGAERVLEERALGDRPRAGRPPRGACRA